MMSKRPEQIVRYQRKPLTAEQIARLDALTNRPDDEIDFSDIPEWTEKDFAHAIRPNLYPPVPIDAEVPEWFMERASSKADLIFKLNRVLQNYVRAQKRKAAKKAG
jgi:hypothetical protein